MYPYAPTPMYLQSVQGHFSAELSTVVPQTQRSGGNFALLHLQRTFKQQHVSCIRSQDRFSPPRRGLTEPLHPSAAAPSPPPSQCSTQCGRYTSPTPPPPSTPTPLPPPGADGGFLFAERLQLPSSRCEKTNILAGLISDQIFPLPIAECKANLS